MPYFSMSIPLTQQAEQEVLTQAYHTPPTPDFKPLKRCETEVILPDLIVKPTPIPPTSSSKDSGTIVQRDMARLINRLLNSNDCYSHINDYLHEILKLFNVIFYQRTQVFGNVKLPVPPEAEAYNGIDFRNALKREVYKMRSAELE